MLLFSNSIGNKTWWITGGIGATVSHTTEFYEYGEFLGSLVKVDLPIGVYGHCMVSFDSSVFLIGGYHGRVEENFGISSDVWAWDFSNGYTSPDVKLLNSLKQARMKHSCGLLEQTSGERILVVAGGFDGRKSLDSVEVLDFQGSLGIYSKWREAQKLPEPLHGGGGVLPGLKPYCGKIFFVGGKSTFTRHLHDTIYEFDGTNWRLHSSKLSFGRADFALIKDDNFC